MSHSDGYISYFSKLFPKKKNSTASKMKILLELDNISQNSLQFNSFSMRKCISDFSTETLSQEEINCHSQSMEKLYYIAYKI